MQKIDVKEHAVKRGSCFFLLCTFWEWCIHIQIYFIPSEMAESQHVIQQSWILYNSSAKTWVSKNRLPCLDVEVILQSTCKWLKDTTKTCFLQKDRILFYGTEGVQPCIWQHCLWVSFCYFHHTRKFQGFGDKTVYRVGMQQGHKSKIKFLQEIVCTLIVFTIFSFSFQAFPKSQNRLPVHTWAVIKRVLLSESLQGYFSRLTLRSNNPAPPCKDKLQPLHGHLTHTHLTH
jgi:hypothetical protein